MQLSFSGDCTVARAEEIRATLLEALHSGGSIEVDLREVTGIDLTFCQMLYALRLSCKAKGVQLTLPDNLPETLATQATFCGMPELAGLAHKDEAQETEDAR